MFTFGLLEILIVLALISWAFRKWIARRWPRTGRSVQVFLYALLAGVLLFDLIAWLRR